MQWQKQIVLYFSIFSICFVVSFSFPFQIIPNIGGWLDPFFNILVVEIGSLFTDLSAGDLHYHSGEDSIGMYVNTLNVLAISLMIYGLLFSIWKQKLLRLTPYAILFLRYYLALMLLIYGFDKIYKCQFYYPEPNILYTPFKDLPNDLRYWSVMGTSYSYSVFAGVIEVIPALLLLWRRTYVLGAAIAFFVFANVLMTNIGFDITVKLFSAFLWLMSSILLLPFLKNILSFFTGKSASLSIVEIPAIYKSRVYVPLKIIVLIVFLIECQYKMVISGNYNDDWQPRPTLHGTYKVIDAMSENKDWNRVHFHRQGYIIVEDDNGNFYDYPFKNDEANRTLVVQTYELSSFNVKYKVANDTIFLDSKENQMQVTAVKVYSFTP